MSSTDLLINFIQELEDGFDQVYQQQAQKQPFHDGTSTPLLPNRLPLKRRFAEFRHAFQSKRPDDSLALERFKTGVLAVERFRDLAPAFVLAVFEEAFVLEPGDVGPISFAHSVAEELIWALNNQQLTPALMDVLVETGGQSYDGCLVIGLVDYRKQAFGMGPAAQAHPTASLVASMKASSATQPEMHKILLRPSHRTLIGEIERSALTPEGALEAESRLLLATAGPVCLDPSPVVGAALRALHYDRDKANTALSSLTQPPRPSQETPTESDAPTRQRFRLAACIEASKSAQKASDAEPYYGLDVKKDPMRFKEIPPNTPLFAWVSPNQRLWRTIRFESTKITNCETAVLAPRKRVHYTLHILLNVAHQNFEGILRLGSQPFTAIDGQTIRFSLPGKAAVENYIERFQQLMLCDGNQCVGDVSNPAVFSALLPPPPGRTMPSAAPPAQPRPATPGWRFE